MDTLPAEIVAVVADRLDTRDALSLGATCWPYHDLVHSVCANQIQRERDWLAHRERIKDTFDAINTGYYTRINDDGVKSFKVVDHRCFRYVVCRSNGDLVGMRMSADDPSWCVFGINWQLCECNDGGYYLRYCTTLYGPTTGPGHYRVDDVGAFARQIAAACGNLPEPY